MLSLFKILQFTAMCLEDAIYARSTNGRVCCSLQWMYKFAAAAAAAAAAAVVALPGDAMGTAQCTSARDCTPPHKQNRNPVSQEHISHSEMGLLSVWLK